MLKYVLSMQPLPLALLVKSYTLEVGSSPPGDPSTTDWRKIFQALFSSFTSVETQASKQLTMTNSLDAVEAVIDGMGTQPAVPMRVRERRAVMGNEQFIVTAIGSPAAFQQHGDEIDRWFSTSAVVPLQEKPKGEGD